MSRGRGQVLEEEQDRLLVQNLAAQARFSAACSFPPACAIRSPGFAPETEVMRFLMRNNKKPSYLSFKLFDTVSCIQGASEIA